MSAITNVILLYDLEDDAAAQSLNATLRSEDHLDLERVDSYAGGEKVMVAPVMLGAFNHTSPEEIAEAVSKQRWRYPQLVRLFCLYDEQEKWREMELFQ